MEDVHRRLIRGNLEKIISSLAEQEFDSVCKELVSLCIYPQVLIDKVLVSCRFLRSLIFIVFTK